MYRRLIVVLALVLALGMTAVPAVQAAEITDVQADDTVVDPSDDPEFVDLSVQNDGENSTAADVTISDSPSGVTVTHPGSETLDPGSNTVTLEVTAENDADDGTVSGDVNGEQFDFEVTVENPPLAGFEDEPLDLGDVLVGETTADELVVEEVGGEEGLDGVEATVISGDANADLEFDDMEGGGFGSDGVQTGPGGEDTAGWEIDVNDDASQHADLSWTVELHDTNHPDATRTVDIEARVIYPPEFGESLFIDDEFNFDEPRDEVSVITGTNEFDISNSGDLALPLDDIDVAADGIEMQAEEFPEEIEGQESVVVEIGVAADTDLEEGEYEFLVSPDAGDFDIDETEYEGTIQDSFFSHTVEDVEYEDEIEIIHETHLTVDGTVSIGDVPIGESDSATATATEELGYNDIENVEVQLESGPESWLDLDAAPTRVNAGSSSSLAFDLDFDTGAELGNDYTWEYTVEGDDVETQTVTVFASPVPLDLDPIRNDLSSYDNPVATDTVAIVDEMDEQMQAGDTDGDDISTVLTFGESTTLYLEAVGEASDLTDAGEHDEAQSEIVAAAAAYNTMSLYSESIEDPGLRADSETVLDIADDDLTAVIDAQESHYESQLESGELSLIEEATVQRQLSRIALLQGNDERAAELEADAEEAFEAYSTAVADGESAAQEGDEIWATMEDEQFVSVAGQQFMLNPARYDTFTDNAAEIDATYDEATASFEAAGESSRAEAVRAEYESRSDALETAELSLFVATGLYATLMIGIIGSTARRMYRYTQDARAAVSGDFLMN